jgi:hypothetical protein
MEQKQLEYDLGSENVLKVLGSVEGSRLKVGQRVYSLMVIPAEMENIDQSTYDLLQEYLKKGGSILSFNLNISYIDGTESSKVKDMAEKYPEQWTFAENLDDPAALNLLTGEEFSLIDQKQNGMLYHQRRQFNDGQLVFVVNSHPSKQASAEITIEGKYVTLLDLVTGKSYNYQAKTANGKVTFQIDLSPAGSALFAITDKPFGEQEFKTVTGNETEIISDGPVAVKRESDNVLVVNWLDLKTAKSDKKDVYFMNALIGLFNEKGIELGNPWQHKIQYKKDYLALDSLFKNDSGFEVSYHFYINPNLNKESMKAIRAVVERPGMWGVAVNGQTVEKIPGAYWIDKEFPVYSVGQFLKPGKNTLTLNASRMNILAEVMPVYILGDFLVKPARTGFEIAEGDISTLGSWRDAGLPFYSQKVAYTQTINIENPGNATFKVKLPAWNGTVASVSVNGTPAGLIAWQPYELDVTSLLKGGINEVTVEVTGSLKNTFGFFYQKSEGWIFGPWSWNYAPAKPPSADGYFLVDYGLFKPFELIKLE